VNNQEAFTRIIVHCCLVQTERSYVPGPGICRYAGPNGNSCAVGCLLPRNLSEALDKLGTASWVNIYSTRYDKSLAATQAIKLLKGVDPGLLQRCQVVHDSVRERDALGRKSLWDYFEGVAQQYDDLGLHMPTVMEIGAELDR
jgi:hypothetical protein